jgi:acetyl-CoA C-acetyltransferase
VPGEHIGSVITGNMAPGDFDQFFLPRHIGLYAGVPVEVPAIMVQRICGTGFELFRQAGEQIQAAARGRAGGRHREHDAQPGLPPSTTAPASSWVRRWVQGLHVGGAERPGRWHQHDPDGREPGQEIRHHPRRGRCQLPPTRLPRRWLRSKPAFHAGEIVPVVSEKFELAGYKPRGIKLQGKVTEVAQDTHPASPR